MKRNKWHPLKLMREWDDRKVRTLEDITNRAGEKITAGSICKAMGQTRGRVALSCGAVYISKVEIRKVALLP